jgi:hypothetical protein
MVVLIPIVKTLLFIRIKSLFVRFVIKIALRRRTHFYEISPILAVLASQLFGCDISVPYMDTMFSSAKNMIPAFTGQTHIIEHLNVALCASPGSSEMPVALDPLPPARELLPDLNEVPPQSAALEALLIQIEETQSELRRARGELGFWEEEGRAFFEKEARLYHEAQKSAELQRECEALLSKRDRQEAELAALREQLAKGRS